MILLTMFALSLNGCHHWFRHGGHHGGHHGGYGRHFAPHTMNQFDLKKPLVKASHVNGV